MAWKAVKRAITGRFPYCPCKFCTGGYGTVTASANPVRRSSAGRIYFQFAQTTGARDSPRPFRVGLPGFDGSGLAAGTTWGFREWTLAGPPQLGGPQGSAWPATGWLTGQTGYEWRPGISTAVCNYCPETHEPPQEHDPVTGAACGCGFWAYWKAGGTRLVHWDAGRYWISVLGVIEGTGPTLIGEKGFRCAKARIIALCPLLRVRFRPLGASEAISGRASQLAARFGTSGITVQLARMYPDARIFTSPDAMLSAYPPGERPGSAACPPYPG